MASHGTAFPMVLNPLTTTQASPAHPPSITQPSGPRVSPSPQPMDPVLQVLQRGCWDTWTKTTPWGWEVAARATETCLTRSRTLYLTTAQPPVIPAPAALPVVQVIQTRHGGANNATLPLRYLTGSFVFRLIFAFLCLPGLCISLCSCFFFLVYIVFLVMVTCLPFEQC